MTIGLAPYGAATADHAPDETQASLRASIKALQEEIEPTTCITYRPDEARAADKRVASVRCIYCPHHTEIHQSQQQTGVWGPDPKSLLETFGWLRRGEHWFCGSTCIARYDAKMRTRTERHEVPPARVVGPGMMANLYATTPPEPKVAPAQDVTTPAAPPATAAQPLRRSR